MKLTLWISSSVPSLCPAASRSTPVASTAMVVTVSTGAMTRNGSRGRPLRPVGVRARVVADEPIAGARQLQQHRRNERHADEHVHDSEAIHMDDGDSLRHQEGDDKGRGGARQDLVAHMNGLG